MNPTPPFRLSLFGSPVLSDPSGAPLSGRATQRHCLALLALLARAPDAGLTRSVVMAYLWPEGDQGQARNRLKVSVYALRQALGQDAIVAVGDALRLGAGVEVDTRSFDAALSGGDHERAVSLQVAPFLEGFFLKESPEFSQWVDRERARLSDALGQALETLAERAAGAGDLSAAVAWWKARAGQDPHDSRIAVRLMKALAAAGSPAAAIKHAEVHARLLEDEIGMDPSAELLALVEQLRAPAAASEAPSVAAGEPASATADEGPSVTATEAASVTSYGGQPPQPSRVDSMPLEPHLPEAPAPRRPAAGRRVALAVAIPALVTAVILLALPLLPLGDRSDEGGVSNADGVLATGDGQAQTESVIAWDLYRRASQPELMRSDSGALAALEMFRRAVEIDPGFAGAHAGLARLYLRSAPDDEASSARDRLLTARRHATTALALDPNLAEAHATLGLAERYLYDFASAEEHLLRARSLDPGDGRFGEWLTQLYVWTGRFDEALALAERAVAADPLSPTALGELGRALMVSGRCDEALRVVVPLQRLEPPLLRAGAIAAQCYALQGRWDDAIRAVERGLPAAGYTGLATLAHMLGRSGRVGEAQAILEELLGERREGDDTAFAIAVAVAGLGDVPEALAWLERATEEHSLSFDVMEPMFAEVRAHPDFHTLATRIGVESPGVRP